MRKLLVCAGALAVGLLATTAFASPTATPKTTTTPTTAVGSTGATTPMPTMSASGVQMMKDRFAAADTNHDGKVSKAEWDAANKARFATLDTNHDGKMSMDEVTAALKGKTEMSPADYMKQSDTDKNGSISEAEYVGAWDARFDSMDTNHDGSMAKDEQDAAVAGMAAPATPATPATPAKPPGH
jgi:Ca2+-binding EF-hand superfamily protein